MLQQNGRPRDWDFNHTRLRSKTWNSRILPIQCLFSKLRRSYAPFWQKVITVIVALFPKLKLNRTLWGGDSGVQICCTVKYRLYSASLTFPEFQRVDSNNCQSKKERNTETEGKQSNSGTALRRSWFLLKEICITMSFEFFYRTGAPTQVEDGNFRLNTRFLEHISVAWPPAINTAVPPVSGDQWWSSC